MKIDLKSLSKQDKIDFLKKVASGSFRIGSIDGKPELNFERTESGLYLCAETNELKTQEEVELMAESYRFEIEMVSDLDTPPDGMILIPSNDLDSLLVRN